VRHVRDDYTKANLTDRERAMCDYAKKLSLTPGAMREQDLEPLRAVGLSDPEIHDAVQVIAYFNYINRIADALGTDLEEWMPERPAGWVEEPHET
jgi:uncharacterized peroxidase-related enzyme